eukprot:COSAG02_NODE_46149_length_351_cov_0.912698_1_plen_94_part_01
MQAEIVIMFHQSICTLAAATEIQTLQVCVPVCLWRCLWRCRSVALSVRSRVYASVYVPVCLLYTEILCRSRHFDWDVDVPLLGNMCLGELVALC